MTRGGSAAAALICAAPAAILFQRPAPFDLLIRNGRVLDGTGAPQTADLGIRDGRIAGMGDPMPRPPV